MARRPPAHSLPPQHGGHSRTLPLPIKASPPPTPQAAQYPHSRGVLDAREDLPPIKNPERHGDRQGTVSGHPPPLEPPTLAFLRDCRHLRRSTWYVDAGRVATPPQPEYCDPALFGKSPSRSEP